MKKSVPFEEERPVLFVHTNSSKRKKNRRGKVIRLTNWYLDAVAEYKPERMNGKNVVPMFPDERSAA